MFYDSNEFNLVCILPHPSPTLPSESIEIVFGSDNKTENTGQFHCEKTMNPVIEPNFVVQVIVSEFKNLENDDGGAIHLINCGFSCDKTVFTECKSNNSGGGAIYINNGNDLLNGVNLKES